MTHPQNESTAAASSEDAKSKRNIERNYDDPLDLVWLSTAEKLGWNIKRTDAVYASWDGSSTLSIATAETMDLDDCLAQMIFHEICHAIVEGDHGYPLRDWGLENVDDRDLVREHACHRLQAALATPYGLRGFFAVTTEWRNYYDALPLEPLSDGSDPAITISRAAFQRALQPPWSAPIQEALRATRAIAEAISPFVDEASLWKTIGPCKPPQGG